MSLGSVVVIPTVFEMVLMTFQFASTAFAVTFNAIPAVWTEGVPILPLVLPGAAVSPGTNNCSLTNGPGLTITLLLVLAVNAPAASVAVMVRAPEVLNVKLERVRVPETNVKLPAVAPLSSAITALVSVLVMIIFGVAP